MPHSVLRTALLAGTAMILPGAAIAQAPNARPQGGQVVGGSAVIDQSNAGRTRIVQSTDRAAVDWRSFDIGRDQVVQFQQPGSTSVTLNRVTGPDPSAIAGRIQANGQVAIVNQSGVVFHQGSRVDAAGLVVSTANISNQAFMAGGRMVFNQPGRADARIENQGEISVRDAGLAALVAPQVANRGRITARTGRVVLAGAETSAVDLHGDGLLSLEILSPVRTRPGNGEALVTNTGTITATGGTVVLSAAAVDGIVQDLVRAGGRVSAGTDPTTGRTGRVVVAGTGGAVRIEGEISATGKAPNSRGGSVEIIGDRTWIAPGAVVDASGRAGGGTVNIGTSRTRLARRTGIAPGAVVRADATERGDGGRVVVNSSDYTAHAGQISANGGPQGGNGGFVEVSGQQSLAITGQVRVNAGLGGLPGTFLIDPTDLTIVADGDASVNVTPADIAGGILTELAPPATAFLAAGSVSGFPGNLVLEASNNITIASAVDKATGDLSFNAGRDIFINAPLILRAGNLALTSETNNSGIGSQINALVQVSAANRVTLGGSAIQTGAGLIVAGRIEFIGAPSSIDLGGANQIAVVGDMPGQTLNRLRNIGDLRVEGTIGRISGNSFTRIDVENGSLTVVGSIIADRQFNTDANILLRASGNILANPDFFGQGIIGAPGSSGGGVGIRMQAGFDFASGTVNRAAPGRIAIGGLVAGADPSTPTTTSAAVDLSAGTGGITQTANFLRATRLTVNSGGDVTIPFFPSNASGSRIDVLGPSDVAGTLVIGTRPANAGTVTLDGTITANTGMQIGVSGNLVQNAGSVIVTPQLDANASGNLTLTGDNRIGAIGSFVAEGGAQLRNVVPLRVTGSFESRSARAEIDVIGGDLDLAATGFVIGDGGVRVRASGAIRTAAGSFIESEPGFSQEINLAAGFDFVANAANPLAAGGLVLAGRVGATDAINSLVLAGGTGGIVQTGGQIIGTTLDIRSGGNATLDRAGLGTPNNVQQLNQAVVAQNFVLDNGTSNLLVRGSNTAATYALRTAGEVTIQADVVATERATFRVGALNVPPPSGVSFPIPGGTVTAPLIEIAPFAQRAVLLPVSPAQLPVAGELLLSTTTLSRMSTGTLRIGATTFDGALTTTAGSVTFPASFTFPGTLDLRAIGNVAQDAGTALNAGRLTGAAGSAFTLANPTNTLPQIDDIAARTTLSLRTTGNQALNGALLAPGVSLTTGGSLAQQGAGRIGNGTLNLQVAGDASLAGANTITALGGSSVGGALVLRNSSTQLAVPGGNTVLAGGALDVVQTGDLVVDGTVSGSVTSLNATGRLQVNGNSAIARTGALDLQADIFGLNGLLQAATGINVTAATEAGLGGRAVAPTLSVSAPRVVFALLDASGAQVSLFLGGGGAASGTLNAAGLSVYGGSGAALFGTIAGVADGPAAALGRRGTQGGVLLSEPLPQAGAFLFNNCPIGAAICQPILLPGPLPSPDPNAGLPPTGGATGEPQIFVAGSLPDFFELFSFQSLASTVVPTERTPPSVNLTLRTGRDASEASELAPPNIRSEDF